MDVPDPQDEKPLTREEYEIEREKLEKENQLLRQSLMASLQEMSLKELDARKFVEEIHSSDTPVAVVIDVADAEKPNEKNITYLDDYEVETIVSDDVSRVRQYFNDETVSSNNAVNNAAEDSAVPTDTFVQSLDVLNIEGDNSIEEVIKENNTAPNISKVKSPIKHAVYGTNHGDTSISKEQLKELKHEQKLKEITWNGRTDCVYQSTLVEDIPSLRVRQKGDRKVLSVGITKVASGKERTTSPAGIYEAGQRRHQTFNPIQLERERERNYKYKSEKTHTATDAAAPTPSFSTNYTPSDKNSFISSSIQSAHGTTDRRELELVAYNRGRQLKGFEGMINPSNKSSVIDNTITPELHPETILGAPTKVVATTASPLRIQSLNTVFNSNNEVELSMWPLHSEMLNDVYVNPIILSILVSKSNVKISKVISRKIDPEYMVHGRAPDDTDGSAPVNEYMPERILLKVYDPLTSYEASVPVQCRELTQYMYSLKEKHAWSKQDLMQNFRFLSLPWWVENAKRIIIVRSKPNGALTLALSKVIIEKMVMATIQGQELPSNSYIRTSGSRISTGVNMKIEKEADEARGRTQGRSRGNNRVKSNSAEKSDKKKSKSPANTKKSTLSITTSAAEVDATSAASSPGAGPTLPAIASPPNLSTVGNELALTVTSPTIKKSAYTNGKDKPTDPFTLSPIIPNKVSRREKVARYAIARARDGTSCKAAFRERKLTDSEIALFESPFAQTYVKPKVYRNLKEAETMGVMFNRAQDNKINEFGRELSSAQAHRLRQGLAT